MAREQQHSHSPRIVNRRARHDYFIAESLECGIVLRGSEVKSIRAGQVSLAEGFAQIHPQTLEFTLFNVNIAEYPQARGGNGHEPTAPRRLLAHKRQVEKLLAQTTARSATLVPLTMYFVRGKVKVEVGLALGKKQHDKRESIKSRETEREIQRHLSKRPR